MSGATLELARLISCPACRSPLAPAGGAFTCSGCGARWPIVRGIPRFVDSEHYVGSFGWQWRRHRRTQIDSSTRRESERTFAEKTGLSPEDVRGKLVLDVGVGTGRFSDVVARWGGVPVGVDLSLAVLSARRNLDPYYPRAFVAQADLFKLPFEEESFDIVFSIGVLHHTPSTRDAFRAIARYARPGGVVAAAVYGDGGGFTVHGDRYRRYTSAMSHSFLHLLAHAALPNQHLLETVAALFGRQAANDLHRMLPTVTHEDPLWRVLDTFDWLSPRYQWKHDEGEVRRWFEDLGFEDVRHMPERSMVSFRGRRPTSGPLRTPLASEERRSGAVEPLPAWVQAVPLRDFVLAGLLAGEVARTLAAYGGHLAGRRVFSPVGHAARAAVTAGVVTAKRALGIERDILRRPSRPG